MIDIWIAIWFLLTALTGLGIVMTILTWSDLMERITKCVSVAWGALTLVFIILIFYVYVSGKL